LRVRGIDLILSWNERKGLCRSDGEDPDSFAKKNFMMI
jgi:hypothetical protein